MLIVQMVRQYMTSNRTIKIRQKKFRRVCLLKKKSLVKLMTTINVYIENIDHWFDDRMFRIDPNEFFV